MADAIATPDVVGVAVSISLPTRGFPVAAESWDAGATKSVVQRMTEYIGNMAVPETNSLRETLLSPTVGHTHDGVAAGKVVNALDIAQSLLAALTADITTSNTTANTDVLVGSYSAASPGLHALFSASGTIANTSGAAVNYTPKIRVAATFLAAAAVSIPDTTTANWRMQGSITFRSSPTCSVDLAYEDDLGNRRIVNGTFASLTTYTMALVMTMGTAHANASWTVVDATIRPGKS